MDKFCPRCSPSDTDINAAIVACRITGWHGVADRLEKGWRPEPGTSEWNLLELFFKHRTALSEAVQWNGHLATLKPWMDELGSLPIVIKPIPSLTVTTPHGEVIAKVGDWIVRDATNNFHVRSPDVFLAEYNQISS